MCAAHDRSAQARPSMSYISLVCMAMKLKLNPLSSLGGLQSIKSQLAAKLVHMLVAFDLWA